MHFSHALTALVGGLSLATAAAVHPIRDAKLAARNAIQARGDDDLYKDDKFEDLDIDDDVAENMLLHCKGDKGKRAGNNDDAPAGFDPVRTGRVETKLSILPGGLFTDELVSCIGVVITGVPDSDFKTSRIMAHCFGVSAQIDENWKKIVQESEGLKDMRGYLSFPNLDEDTPDENWGEEEDEAARKVEERLTDKVRALIKRDPVVEYHKMKSSKARVGAEGQMSVDKELKVKINGVDVTQK